MAMVMENQQPLAPMPAVPAPPLPPPPPPPLPPPPQAYKHRCKVCKKGFMCGRALGGHMRAHGVTDDGLSADDDALDDDDDESVPCGGAWDSSEAAAAAATTTKRMYSLRTNAGRHKNCRACENCGKEFTSWKSLLDHGRCNYDREKDDLNIAGADIDGEDEEDLALVAGGWFKGKRTRRTKVIVVDNGSQIDEPQLVPTTSREEEDLANCLVMLASSSGGLQPQAIVDVHQQPYDASTSKNERTSASKHEQRFLVPPQPISMLPPTVPQFKFLAPPQVMPSPVVPRGLFECKACKKVFTSHQALGGHRASHKKVKGCFAAKLEESSRNDSPQPSAASSNDNVKVVVEAIPAIVDTTESNGVDGNAEVNMLNARTTAIVAATSAPEMANIMQVDEAPSSSTVSPFKKKGKVHECSICHRVFMSGQALGGHKRCHWLTTGAGDPTTAVAKLPFITQDHVMHAAMCQQLTLGPPVYGTSDSCLDLNVPMNQSADPAATRQAAGINESMLSLNAPASLYMHSWAGHTNASNMHNTAATSGHYDLPEATAATEDEADSTSAKRAKISDLKDMNMAGETSPWLQVGIALPSETSERLLKPKG